MKNPLLFLECRPTNVDCLGHVSALHDCTKDEYKERRMKDLTKGERSSQKPFVNIFYKDSTEDWFLKNLAGLKIM